MPAILPPLLNEYQSAKARLTLRKGLFKVGQLVTANPTLSFPQMAGNASQLNNIYRFVGHADVSPGAILEPHFRNTLERIGDQEVLALHDSTNLVFPGQRGDLGYINRDSHGFMAQIGLIVAADGSRRPLGVLALETLNRAQQVPEGTAAERRKPIAERRKDPERESERWWRGLKSVEEAIGNTAKVINIGDSETDNYALVARAVEAGYRFVFRVSQDRVVDSEIRGVKHLFDLRGTAKPVLRREVPLSSRKLQSGKANPPRESRVASLRFAAYQTRIVCPKSQSKQLPASISINLVHVWEVKAPAGEKPVEWLLMTTEPVETKLQIEKIVDWYRARWTIEEFFKGLKTVCRFEARQLKSYHSLANALAIFLPCAWHTLLLRYLERNCPDEPAAKSLSPTQIAVLENLPPKKLKAKATISEAYRLIAAWGGHLPQNGPPGWQTLYIGYKKMQDAASVWEKALTTRDGKN